MDKEYLYRYDESTISRGLDQWEDPLPGYVLKLHLEQFEILKRTPKGAWIRRYKFKLFGSSKNKRFVLLTARKKFACPTKDEALESFKARKRRQIEILEHRLKKAKLALELAEERNFEVGKVVWE